jgi:NADH-quinone oxidoreductase subunit M
LIEGTIEQHGWLVAIAILIGNVLAAAFLLWVFQRVFIAHRKRAIQPYSSLHHPIFRERMIAITIIVLLIGTGFDTTPLLNFIDKKAASISKAYPKIEP